MQTVNFTEIEISSLHNTTNLISAIIKSNILKKKKQITYISIVNDEIVPTLPHVYAKSINF